MTAMSAMNTTPRPDVDAVVPRLAIDSAGIATAQAAYAEGRSPYTASQTSVLTAADVRAERCTVEKLVAQLTAEEMADICVGTLRTEGSVVGNASCNVPGAAGDTSSIIKESRGVKNMVLADGPAGLRLRPLSIMTSYNLLNGIHTANHFELLQSVARDERGGRGFIMTDWFTSQHQPAFAGAEEGVYPISASTGCVYAGNDVQMPGCQKNVDDLVQAVTAGEEMDGYRISLADLQFNAANVIRIAIAADI